MLAKKVKHTIKKYDLISPGDKILVGVSGGPDSLTLLYVLNRLKAELGLSLHIAHLDHGLRKNSRSDLKFVTGVAKRLGIPCSSMSIDLKKKQKRGSLEERARDARYDFFLRTAKKINAHKIAVGHTLDDQAETVLMRIIRGSGLYGLRGILPKRDIRGYCVVRPLIEVPRKEIEEFLRNNRIKARVDLSNFQDIYLRNKIRNKLLPLLEKYFNPNIKEVLSNLAQSAGYDYDYLIAQARKKSEKMRKNINLKAFSKLHPAMQRLILRQSIGNLKGDTRRISLKHILEIEDLIIKRPVNSIVDLPQGVSLVKRNKTLRIYRHSTK